MKKTIDYGNEIYYYVVPVYDWRNTAGDGADGKCRAPDVHL